MSPRHRRRTTIAAPLGLALAGALLPPSAVAAAAAPAYALRAPGRTAVVDAPDDADWRYRQAGEGRPKRVDATDVTSLEVTVRDDERLVFRVAMTDLRILQGRQQLTIDVARGPRTVDNRLTSSPDFVRVDTDIDARRFARPCPGSRSDWDPDTDVVTLVVPLACVGPRLRYAFEADATATTFRWSAEDSTASTGRLPVR